MKNVGTRVRVKRAERDWTQEQLAERSGMHRNRISKIEAGEAEIRLEEAQRLATAFGEPITALTDDAAPATPPQAQQNDRGPTVREPQITTAVNGDSEVKPAVTGDQVQQR